MSKTKAQLQKELSAVKRRLAAKGGRPLARPVVYRYPAGVTKVRQVKPKDDMSIGERVGSAAGRFLGGAAQKAFKALTGFGDYKVSKNSIAMGTAPPVFRDGKRTNIVCHREYIADVLGSVNFRNTSYALNPGQQGTYPWLSALAQQYEEYSVHGMVWEFKSTAGSAVSSTNNALGVVIMATEYNSLNPPFASKIEMENYQFCTSAKPSESFLHPVECARGENVLSNLYVRSGSVPVGADKRFYDLGNFQIATQGMQVDDITVGELWCTYEIELIKPRVVAAVGESILSDHYVWSTIQANTIFGASCFGTVASSSAFLPKTGSSLGTSIITANKIQFPNDNVLSTGEIVQISYTLAMQDSATISAAGPPTFGSCFSYALMFNQGTTTQFGNSGTGGTLMYTTTLQRNSVVATSDADLQVTLPIIVPAAGSECTLIITQLNSQTTPTLLSAKRLALVKQEKEAKAEEKEDSAEAAEYEAYLKWKAFQEKRSKFEHEDDGELVSASGSPPGRTPTKLASRK